MTDVTFLTTLLSLMSIIENFLSDIVIFTYLALMSKYLVLAMLCIRNALHSQC